MSQCLICFGSHRHTPFTCSEDSLPEPEWPPELRHLAEQARREPLSITDAEASWLKVFWGTGKLLQAASLAFSTRPSAAGSHLGTPGERIAVRVTVEAIVQLPPGDYGDRYLCKMRDQENNLLVWFTGDNLAFDEGETYSVKGTVKAHGEYEGEKQTIIQRVKETT